LSSSRGGGVGSANLSTSAMMMMMHIGEQEVSSFTTYRVFRMNEMSRYTMPSFTPTFVAAVA
jgi:hypothetical protein